jgi:hypothetical protein
MRGRQRWTRCLRAGDVAVVGQTGWNGVLDIGIPLGKLYNGLFYGAEVVESLLQPDVG